MQKHSLDPFIKTDKFQLTINPILYPLHHFSFILSEISLVPIQYLGELNRQSWLFHYHIDLSSSIVKLLSNISIIIESFYVGTGSPKYKLPQHNQQPKTT